MKRHELSRRDVLHSAAAAAIGLSAATLAGCASTAPATAEPGGPPKSKTPTGTSSLARSTTAAPAAAAEAMRRADALLRQMTIEEKAMQLSSLYPMGLLGADGPIKSQLEAQIGHGIGHICGLGLLGHKQPETIAKTVNAIQRYLVTETRLKIPVFHNEALNGVVAPHFTRVQRTTLARPR